MPSWIASSRDRWAGLRHRRAIAVGAVVVVAAGLAAATASASTHAPAKASASAAAAGKQATSATSGANNSANANADALTAATQQPSTVNLTLITGDKVSLMTSDGQQTVNPANTNAQADSDFVQFTWAGDHYLVPDVAVPYLRTGVLDPRLFDVSYLARAKFGASLPVQVTYSGASAPSLAGLTVSHTTGGTATGTMAVAQGTQLANLLAKGQAAAIASKTGAGLLDGITSISLAPPASAPALPVSPTAAGGLAAAGGAGGATRNAQPNLHYYTLTLKFTNPDGSAGTALGFMQNLDDVNLSPGIMFATFTTLGTTGEIQGQVSVSVPAGNYSAEFSIVTPHTGTILGYDATLVTDLQFSVNGNKTVTMSSAGAVPYQPSVAGVSSEDSTDEMGFVRLGNAGAGINATFATAEAMYLLSETLNGAHSREVMSAVPTTGAVTQGSFDFDAFTDLNTDQPASTPRYQLVFPYHNKIPSSLTFNLSQRDLTTFNYNAYADPTGSCGHADDMELPVYTKATGLKFGDGGYGGTAPGTTTTYYWYDGNPALDVWEPLWTDADCNPRYIPNPMPYKELRTITDGSTITEDWGKAPVGAPSAHDVVFPQGDVTSITEGTTGGSIMCVACRQDDNAEMFLSPYSDSNTNHISTEEQLQDDQLASAMSFYRNGKLALTDDYPTVQPCFSEVLGGDSTNAVIDSCSLEPQDGVDLPLLPQQASYELRWAYQEVGDPSATSDNDWTFQSGPNPRAGKLADGVPCIPEPTRGCSYLPLLFISYNLPLSMDNTAPAGSAFPIRFTVAHQQGEPAPAGVTATVSASFDNGTTWSTPQPATSSGSDQFTATITQPALADTSGFVSLRVTATDGAGNALTQTLIKAYGLSS